MTPFPRFPFCFRKATPLFPRKEEADLAYKPDLLLESEQEWAKRLVEERAKDRIMGNTRRGPHRDDFTFLCNGKDARTFASEGQQRGLVLALRFAEFFFVRQVRNQTPLILADGVLGELDDERKANFKQLLPRGSSLCHGDFVPIPRRRGQMGNFPGFFRHLFEKLAFQSVQVLSCPSSCKFLSH